MVQRFRWLALWGLTVMGTMACYATPATPHTDFGSSVLVLSAPNMVGGNLVGVSVVLRDSNGAGIPNSIVQIQAADCDVTQPTTPTNNDGVATGTILPGPTGQHLITATVTVASEQVTLPAASSFKILSVVTNDTNSVQAGVPLNMQAVARLPNGDIDSSYTGTVHFQSSDPEATLPADAPMPASCRGVEIWPEGITLRTTGVQTVQITDATTGATLASESFSVVAGPIAKLAFMDYPTTATVGVPFAASVYAEVPSGATLQSYTATVEFGSSDSSAKLPAATSFTPTDAGMLSFTFTMTRVGTQSVTVTDGVSVGTFYVTVSPGPAVSFAMSGLPVPATAFAPYPLHVNAVDAYGNTATSYTGTVTFTSTDLQASLPNDLTMATADAGSKAAGNIYFESYGNVGLTATDTANPNLTGTLTTLTHRVVSMSHQSGITPGLETSCFRIDDGYLKCTGANTVGQLGYGDTLPRGTSASQMGTNLPYLDLGTGITAQYAVGGAQHVCALLHSGAIKCWGDNTQGQLGLGDTIHRGSTPGSMGDALPNVDSPYTFVSISAGANHTCGVTNGHQIVCWGANDYGQLGYGDTQQRGDTLASMGTALPYVPLGTGRTAAYVYAGAYHTCVVLDSQDALCWGYNASGQLGLGDTNNRGDNPNEMGDALPTVNFGTGLYAVQLSTGGYHTCIRTGAGTLKCWGDNSAGQLGLGDTMNRGDAPGTMGDALPFLDLSGMSVRTISLGMFSSSALYGITGATRCWGENNRGQLGLGDLAPRGAAPGTMGDNLPNINIGTGRTALFTTMGPDHTCALSDIGILKCWGDNSYGQLANGANGNVGTAAIQMGDVMLPVSLW